MQPETLQQLKNKLSASLIDEHDEWRYEQLSEKYDNIFNEIVEHYLLDDVPKVHEQIKEALKIAQIKEYFLQKDISISVNKILKRASN